jgi:hypothetical protein
VRRLGASGIKIDEELPPESAIEAFRDTARQEQFQCVRSSRNNIAVKIAVALRHNILINVFLMEEGKAAEENGIQLDQMDRPENCRELLALLKQGSILRKDLPLGANRMLVWATRLEQKWEDLASECERTQRADRVRDWLGLPHSAKTTYFELRSRKSIGELCGPGSRRAAPPTALDAAGHVRFKQEPDEEPEEDWNRAVDLGRAFIEKAGNADGAPELVIETLHLDEVEWTRCLGTTLEDAPGLHDHNAFIERLARSRTDGSREVEQILRDLIRRLRHGPAQSP